MKNLTPTEGDKRRITAAREPSNIVRLHARRADAAETTIEAGVKKRVVTMADLNERFAILRSPGSASIFVSRADLLPITDLDLKRRLAEEVVQTDGKPTYMSAYKFWTGHSDKHVFRDTVFTSRPVADDIFNLFRGFGVTPAPGKCDLILKHIEGIAAGDKEAANSMVRLMAWQIQNIGEPSRIVVVLKSNKQQTGKGILLGDTLLRIYRPSGFKPSSTDQVLGRFNDALRGRAYAFLDEVTFSGDRRAANNIKSLSTTKEMGLETKGLPIVMSPIAINLWLASNHDNAAHVEEHDARYSISTSVSIASTIPRTSRRWPRRWRAADWKRSRIIS